MGNISSAVLDPYIPSPDTKKKLKEIDEGKSAGLAIQELPQEQQDAVHEDLKLLKQIDELFQENGIEQSRLLNSEKVDKIVSGFLSKELYALTESIPDSKLARRIVDTMVTENLQRLPRIMWAIIITNIKAMKTLNITEEDIEDIWVKAIALNEIHDAVEVTRVEERESELEDEEVLIKLIERLSKLHTRIEKDPSFVKGIMATQAPARDKEKIGKFANALQVEIDKLLTELLSAEAQS
jgi:hypothetical protein